MFFKLCIFNIIIEQNDSSSLHPKFAVSSQLGFIALWQVSETEFDQFALIVAAEGEAKADAAGAEECEEAPADDAGSGTMNFTDLDRC